MKYSIVYTSAYVFEIDTVREAFKNSNIPFYVQNEDLAGVRTAFPASPVSGFGTRWHVFVPRKVESEAKEILSTLNLSVDSDLKPFPAVSPTDFRRYFWKALILVSPIIAALGYILYSTIAKR